MKRVIIFYAGLVYGDYDVCPRRADLPDGVFIYFKEAHEKQWFLKDLTPVLLQDVPKELLLNVLLLT